MAKKGSRRPHRVEFTWTGTDIKSTETFETTERAEDFMREMAERATRTGSGLELRRLLRIDAAGGGSRYLTQETNSVPADAAAAARWQSEQFPRGYDERD
jgi:hypothetical protein